MFWDQNSSFSHYSSFNQNILEYNIYNEETN